MAFRTWGRLLLTALGVSMLAGAGQLGIAYGFGIVRLTGDFTDVNRWPAQLAWVGWFAVTAAIVGAVLTGRLARREGLPEDTPVQLAISGAAALGALVVAPLCMQPARAAELSAVDPVWAVGICAVAGAVVGAGAASAVLLRPPLGWNVAVLGGAIWLVALCSAAPGVLSTEPLRTVRLGVLEPAWLGPDRAQRLAMLLLPLIALVAGAVTGGLARRRGHLPLIGGATGAAGPVLLAFAYLTAGPGDPVDRYQLAPYYGAVIAVATGALGSVAATLLRWPLLPARAAASSDSASSDSASSGDDDGDAAIEPTDILAPLPAVPAPNRTDSDGTVSVPAASDRAASGRAASDEPVNSGRAASDEPVTVELGAAARSLDQDRPDGTVARAAGGGDVPPGISDTGVLPGVGRPSADTPGAGRNPAHWDWPDPSATVTDRTATRSAPTPSGLSRAESTPTEPGPTAPTQAGPAQTGPAQTAPTPTGPAQTEPTPTTAARTKPAQTAPAPTRQARAGSARTEVTEAEQVEDAGPPTGDEPVAAPRPRAKRASRTRPVVTGSPAPPAGRPASDPPADPGGAEEGQRAAVAEPAPAGTAAPETAGRGTAHPGAPTAGTAPQVTGLRHVSPDGVEGTPRPRHQLPDLSGTGGSTDAPRPVPARASLPFPEPEAVERTDPLGPVSLRWEADGSRAAAPVDRASTDPTSADPASADPASVDPAPTGVDEQKPSGRAKGRRGLFRRNRSPEGAPANEPTAEPATPDDEYVDWVAGLSKPLADNEPERESGRRSLRTSGRHHHRE
ncbi:hypothetical protein [Micromonospora sp. NBC_00421]|uniref:hypothetical protein n=1 Tax=Micromonospora sp. NBC_00421 TaxID=2975976 RepID=UPI002E22D03E